MRKVRSPATLVVVAFATSLAATAGIPIMATGLVGPSASPICTPGQLAAPAGGTPTILGPSTLTPTELTTWWDSGGRGQPERLTAPIDDLITLYLTEGEAEGVRGDIALAQAVHETGHFASPDTARNNFAGIGHPEGATGGPAFTDARTGVRAHIQLLKKFAAGNGVRLAHADVAPDAAARARTWGELAGTWAADRDYWTGISRVYGEMLSNASRDISQTRPAASAACGPTVPAVGELREGDLVEVRGIVVHRTIAADLDRLLATAEGDGLTLGGSGYRSHERQIELRRAHCGTSQYAIYEMPSSQCSPPTARPGNSMHERGLAIDFTCNGELIGTRSGPCYQWLADNAADFGLFNLPSEPWHWSVDGS